MNCALLFIAARAIVCCHCTALQPARTSGLCSYGCQDFACERCVYAVCNAAARGAVVRSYGRQMRQHRPRVGPAQQASTTARRRRRRHSLTPHVSKERGLLGLVSYDARTLSSSSKAVEGCKTGSGGRAASVLQWLVRNTPAQRRSIANGATRRRAFGWQQVSSKAAAGSLSRPWP